MSKRRRFLPEFKAKVAPDALSDEMTLQRGEPKLGPLFVKVLKRGGWEVFIVTAGMAAVIPLKLLAFRNWNALDN